MSEIPNDIMETAEETLDKLLCNCTESCGGHAGMRAASIKDIAMAIAAEREACAKIAVIHEADYLSPEYAQGQPASSFGERFACQNIARAIRERNRTTSNN